jgi:putative membrane protein (TIGR04086 family)
MTGTVPEASVKLRWARILAGGVLAWVGSFLLVFLIIGSYACRLGFEARGQPDPNRIEQFANEVAPTWAPIFLVLGTLAAGYWAARKASAKRPLHGLLVGAVAVLLTTPFMGSLSLRAVVGRLLALAAGWLGGYLAGRRRRDSSKTAGATGA